MPAWISYYLAICKRSFSAILISCCFLLLNESVQGQVLQLYHSARTTGIINEIHPTTGVTLATNVGGLTDARGMAFSPLGGLYATHGSQVSVITTSASAASPVLTYVGETPHDVNFDAVGNMYVVTNLNVYVYNTSLVQTLTFAHGLTTTTGDGNPEKGWGIAVRPDNGEIYVVGRQGMRHYNPATGVQIGSTISGSSFGFAGIAFTGSAFSNAYIYVGNVISGVDQIRVFDTGLNLLRTFFAPHIGNPIDLEVNYLNNDIYLFNTVASNPANRFLSTETTAAGFSTVARPTRGSALGSFPPILNAPLGIRLQIEETKYGQHLTWELQGENALSHFEIVRSGDDLNFERLGKVEANQPFAFTDLFPLSSKSVYKVFAIDLNGETVGSSVVFAEGRADRLQLLQNSNVSHLSLQAVNPEIYRLEGRLLTLNGGECRRKATDGNSLEISYEQFAAGLYLFEGRGIDQFGNTISFLQKKIAIIK